MFPQDYKIEDPYPHPFNPIGNVKFEIPLNSPYILKHSIAYSEHVGRYLHDGVK